MRPSPRDDWSAIADSLAAALIGTLNGTVTREDAEARLAAYYEFTPGVRGESLPEKGE